VDRETGAVEVVPAGSGAAGEFTVDAEKIRRAIQRIEEGESK